MSEMSEKFEISHTDENTGERKIMNCQMTKLKLAMIVVGEFLHSEPHDFIAPGYEDAKKEALESWYYIQDSIKDGMGYKICYKEEIK